MASEQSSSKSGCQQQADDELDNNRGVGSDDDLDGELERLFQATNPKVPASRVGDGEAAIVSPRRLQLMHMPDEVLQQILRHTHFARCVCRMAQTCSRFRSLCTSGKLWKSVFDLRWGQVSECRFREHPLSTDSDKGECEYEGMFKAWHKVEENWRTGNCSVNSLEGHSGSVSASQLMGRTLVTAGEDATIKFWDLDLLLCSWSESRAHPGPIWDLKVHHDCIATSASNGSIKVWRCGRGEGAAAWDTSPMRCERVIRGHHQVEVWCCDLDGSNVYTGGRDTAARVWDRETGANYLTLPGLKGSVFVVQAGTEGDESAAGGSHTVLTGGGDGAVLWDMRSGRPGVALQGHRHAVFCADMVGSQGAVFTGSGDGTVRRFDLRKGACGELFSGHEDSVWALQYNSLSRRLASGSVDRSVRVWDGFSGSSTATLECHLEPVMSLTADARRMVSGDSGGWLFVWDFQREGEGAHACNYSTLMSHVGPM